jgi:hypothetical protein
MRFFTILHFSDLRRLTLIKTLLNGLSNRAEKLLRNVVKSVVKSKRENVDQRSWIKFVAGNFSQ